VLRARNIPNTICVLRMLMVAPAVWALMTSRYALALALVTVAGLSDALDGYLAKRYDWRSRLGGLLDPLADKLLLVSLFVTLAWIGLVPVWLAAVVLGRDLVIVSGGVAYNLVIGPVQPEPSRASKLNTLAQLLFLFVVLLARLLPAGALAALITALGAVVFVTSIVSGLDYVIRWSGRAVAART
jgi:cardiolipin synthase